MFRKAEALIAGAPGIKHGLIEDFRRMARFGLIGVGIFRHRFGQGERAADISGPGITQHVNLLLGYGNVCQFRPVRPEPFTAHS